MSRDEAKKIVRALSGGFWKTRRKNLTSENYTLRVRVDPVIDPAAPATPATPVFVDSKLRWDPLKLAHAQKISLYVRKSEVRSEGFAHLRDLIREPIQLVSLCVHK